MSITISQIPIDSEIEIEGILYFYKGQEKVRISAGNVSCQIFKRQEFEGNEKPAKNHNWKIIPISKPLLFEKCKSYYKLLS